MVRMLLVVALTVATVTLACVAGRSPLAWPAVIADVRGRYPAVRQLSLADLAAWLADTNRPPPLLLDARADEEFRVSHLPRAVLADPLSPPAVDRAAPVVVYCSVGYRSSALAERLQAGGFTQVFNLEGGIFVWANGGFPIERDGAPTHAVHPYDERWAVLLDPALRAPGPLPLRRSPAAVVE